MGRSKHKAKKQTHALRQNTSPLADPNNQTAAQAGTQASPQTASQIKAKHLAQLNPDVTIQVLSWLNPEDFFRLSLAEPRLLPFLNDEPTMNGAIRNNPIPWRFQLPVAGPILQLLKKLQETEFEPCRPVYSFNLMINGIGLGEPRMSHHGLSRTIDGVSVNAQHLYLETDEGWKLVLADILVGAPQLNNLGFMYHAPSFLEVLSFDDHETVVRNIGFLAKTGVSPYLFEVASDWTAEIPAEVSNEADTTLCKDHSINYQEIDPEDHEWKTFSALKAITSSALLNLLPSWPELSSLRIFDRPRDSRLIGSDRLCISGKKESIEKFFGLIRKEARILKKH